MLDLMVISEMLTNYKLAQIEMESEISKP